MVTVKVCYASDGKPAKSKRVTLGFSGLMRGMSGPEFTNSSGEAHFDADSGSGEVYVGGKSVYKGRLAGRVIVYI
jgi:hypothetical protein